MSLFDVVRYPIDLSFRRQDIRHLPSDVFCKWEFKIRELDYQAPYFTPTEIEYRLKNYATDEERRDALDNIKKILMEL